MWQFVRELETCRGCGTRRDEWLESAGGHRHAHRWELDRCPGCEQLEYGREALEGKKVGKGVSVRLVRNER